MIKFLKDDSGQGAAEYVLLFGGIIVVAIAALILYKNYTKGLSEEMDTDAQGLNESITNLTKKFD